MYIYTLKCCGFGKIYLLESSKVPQQKPTQSRPLSTKLETVVKGSYTHQGVGKVAKTQQNYPPDFQDSPWKGTIPKGK